MKDLFTEKFSALPNPLKVFASITIRMRYGFKVSSWNKDDECNSPTVIELEKRVIKILLGQTFDDSPSPAYSNGLTISAYDFRPLRRDPKKGILKPGKEENLLSQHIQDTIDTRDQIEATLSKFPELDTVSADLKSYFRTRGIEEQRDFRKGYRDNPNLSGKLENPEFKLNQQESTAFTLWICWPVLRQYRNVQYLHDDLRSLNIDTYDNIEGFRSLCRKIGLKFRQGRIPNT